jgi:methyltransferase-like protein/trans-aconitate methyltransferase
MRSLPPALPEKQMTAPAENSYDRVPYTSFPYPQATPDRMATIATLFGLSPVPPDRSRVLEIGCASAGHLLPLAEQHPESTFVGIDLSTRQIADAEAARNLLGLTNITFRRQDILDLSSADGRFDYIIAHGIYSWIAPHVQQKLLAACRELLTPNGIAFISYNTYPGWHFRGVARGIMKFRCRHISDPQEKLREGKAVLELLIRTVQPDTVYSHILQKERKQLDGKIDDYLLHEYFEDHNQPLYFHEFIGQAAEHGLQFLGEAEFHTLFPINGLANDPEAALREMAADILEVEQYRDMIRNRVFRHTLLCRSELVVDRFLPATRMASVYVASKLQPADREGSPAGPESMVFTHGDISTSSGDPLFKAAMMHLAKIYPASERFEDLYAIAAVRIGVMPARRPLETPDGRSLAVSFLRGYSASAVELSVTRPRFTLSVPERPAAPRFSRFMAAHSDMMTNLRHESYKPNTLERHLVQLLDGTRDRAALNAGIAALVDDGTLTFFHDDKRIVDPVFLRKEIERAVEEHLGRLARRAFIFAP